MSGLHAHGPGAALQRALDHRRAGGRRKSGSALSVALILALAGWILGAVLTRTADGAPSVIGPFSYFPS